MQKSKFIITILLISLSLVGCSTIKGVGKDLTVVGGWISNSSDHVKESIHNRHHHQANSESLHDTYYVVGDLDTNNYQETIEEVDGGTWKKGNSPNLKTDYLIDMSDGS